MTEPVRLLTLTEVAQTLRVSERTVQRLVKAGRIRAKYVGRRPVVTRRELDAYLGAANRPGRVA